MDVNGGRLHHKLPVAHGRGRQPWNIFGVAQRHHGVAAQRDRWRGTHTLLESKHGRMQAQAHGHAQGKRLGLGSELNHIACRQLRRAEARIRQQAQGHQTLAIAHGRLQVAASHQARFGQCLRIGAHHHLAQVGRVRLACVPCEGVEIVGVEHHVGNQLAAVSALDALGRHRALDRKAFGCPDLQGACPQGDGLRLDHAGQLHALAHAVELQRAAGLCHHMATLGQQADGATGKNFARFDGCSAVVSPCFLPHLSQLAQPVGAPVFGFDDQVSLVGGARHINDRLRANPDGLIGQEADAVIGVARATARAREF